MGSVLKTHGGARQGSGRKNPYGEETKQIKFKVPISKETELKTIVHKQLKKWHMKKLLIIAVTALTVSCTTTRPSIQGNNLVQGKDTTKIQYWPTGRAYVVVDGQRKNLYRHPQTVKK
jgi:hypothetical protein